MARLQSIIMKVVGKKIGLFSDGTCPVNGTTDFLPSHRCSGYAWSEVSATEDILEVKSRTAIRAGKPSDSSLSHAFHPKPDMVNMTGT